MKKILIITILTLVAINSFAIGAFNTFNTRNHGELDWKVIESDNIKIIYHDPLIDWANKSIKIAEASYAALAKSYGTKPKEKIRIYISDQDDIANGATIFSSYFFIYVNQTEFLANFSGNDSFLRKVIAHEMSHYFLHNTVADLLTKIFPPASSLIFPRDLNEGFAQYYSGEEWGVVRGDNSLRKAAFSGELLEPNGKIGGGLLYARGFSMVRYLAEFYGEEKLQKLLLFRNDLNIFNLKAAFKDVYDKSFEQIQKEWNQFILTEYYGEAFNLKNLAPSDSIFDYTFQQFKKLEGKATKLSNLKLKNNYSLFLEKSHKDQGYYDLIFAEISPDSLAKNRLHFVEKNKIDKVSYTFNMDLSENGDYAIYCKNIRHQNGSLFPTIYLYNSKSNKTKQIVIGNFPRIFNNGDFIYKTRGNQNSYIKLYQNGSSQELFSFPNVEQIENLSLSPDGTKIAFSRLRDNQFHLEVYKLDSLELISRTDFSTFPRQIIWLDSVSFIVLSGDTENYRMGIDKINLPTGDKIKYLTPIYNIYPIYAKTDSTGLSLITLADYDRKRKTIGTIHLREEPQEFSIIPENDFFSGWKARLADNQIVVSDNLDKLEIISYKYNSLKQIENRFNLFIPTHIGFLAGTFFSEPLGQHYLGGAIFQPYNFKQDNYYYLNYTNKFFNPTIMLSAFKTAYPGKYYDEKLYWQYLSGFNISVSRQYDLISKFFWNLGTNAELTYYDIKNYDDKNNDMIDDQGETLLATGSTFYPKASVNLTYSLPFKNSQLHPVKSFNLNYAFSFADEKLGMNNSFTNNELNLDIAWAPLYEMTSFTPLKTFSLQNRNYLRYQNGDNIGPYQFDDVNLNSEKIYVQDYTVRSKIGKAYNSKQFCNSQFEAWLKLSDNLNSSLTFGFELISVSYAGIAVWYDIFNQTENDETKTSEMSGFELKSVVSILGLPFTCKYGNSFKSYRDIEYLNVSVPFAIF